MRAFKESVWVAECEMMSTESEVYDVDGEQCG